MGTDTQSIFTPAKPWFIPLMALFFSPVATAEKGWYPIVSAEGTTWEMKTNSLDITENKNGELIASVVGRVTKQKRMDLYKWYVSAVDCRNKMGSIVSLTPQGDYEFENDFVLGAGNVASDLASVICGAAVMRLPSIAGKGI